VLYYRFMANPEYSPIKVSPPITPDEAALTLDEIERKLEAADEIENVIERTQQMEALLELVDSYFSEE
jgi:hypothetical protein